MMKALLRVILAAATVTRKDQVYGAADLLVEAFGRIQ